MNPILKPRIASSDAVKALSALAHELRLATFRLLIQAGRQGLAASKISAALGISASALTFHLKELMHANLIFSRQEGRYVIYTAKYETMDSLIDFLMEDCCQGRLCQKENTVRNSGPLCP